MVSKSSILIGIIFSTALLLISAKYYAGDPPYDNNPIDYGWKNNYLINPFEIKAVNNPGNVQAPGYLRNAFPLYKFYFILY